MTSPLCDEIEAETMALVGEEIVAAGTVDVEELERHVSAAATGRLDLTQPPLLTCWGRRPSVRKES